MTLTRAARLQTAQESPRLPTQKVNGLTEKYEIRSLQTGSCQPAMFNTVRSHYCKLTNNAKHTWALAILRHRSLEKRCVAFFLALIN